MKLLVALLLVGLREASLVGEANRAIEPDAPTRVPPSKETTSEGLFGDAMKNLPTGNLPDAMKNLPTGNLPDAMKNLPTGNLPTGDVPDALKNLPHVPEAHKRSAGPAADRSKDFNEETEIDGLPITVETLLAISYLALFISAPVVLALVTEEQLTRAHVIESVALVAWLGGTMVLFTGYLEFQSAHFDGHRPLTMVETVYLLSQILSTVGYGDITPAFAMGQLWIACNVVIAMSLYGSIITEVVCCIQDRIAKALLEQLELNRTSNSPLIDWEGNLSVNRTGLIKSATVFGSSVLAGVLFFHYYPGEEKPWLQAIDLSIITLSSVGFGQDYAVTEGGKVFASIWMLIGVSSLAASISAFIDAMLQEKRREMFLQSNPEQEFETRLKYVSTDPRLDQLEFLKFGLLITKQVEPKEFSRIHNRWVVLQKKWGTDKLTRGMVWTEEGPSL